MRFLHFYPSQQKSLAVGRRVRARGEARGGFFGLEMVHPVARVVTAGTPLPTSLTPVYPSTVQLSQAVLRKAVAAGRARADLDEHLPPGIVPAGLPTLRQALDHLHEPAPGLDAAALEDRSHPAWQRLKFEELLAQQLSQLLAQRERQRQRAPPLATRARPAARGVPCRAAVRADAGAAPRRRRDRRRPRARRADAPAAAGRRRLRQDRRRRARRGARDRRRLAVRVDGADRDPRRAAPEEAGRLARAARRHVAWLTGSRKGRKRDEMLAQVASGEAGLVVGTHAVIEEQVRFARLGLAIIDEQHRFGVAQRLALREKLHDQGELRAAPAYDERDTDSENAGDDALRRPRRQHDRRAAARAHAGRHQALRRHPPRRGDRADPRRGRARQADVLGLPARRRVGGARPQERDRDARRALRRAARQDDRPAARPHAGGREGGGDVALRRRPDRRARRDDGDRGRRRRRRTRR